MGIWGYFLNWWNSNGIWVYVLDWLYWNGIEPNPGISVQTGASEGQVMPMEQQLYQAVLATSSWLDDVENTLFSGAVLLAENAETQLQNNEVGHCYTWIVTSLFVKHTTSALLVLCHLKMWSWSLETVIWSPVTPLALRCLQIWRICIGKYCSGGASTVSLPP